MERTPHLLLKGFCSRVEYSRTRGGHSVLKSFVKSLSSHILVIPMFNRNDIKVEILQGKYILRSVSVELK